MSGLASRAGGPGNAFTHSGRFVCSLLLTSLVSIGLYAQVRIGKGLVIFDGGLSHIIRPDTITVLDANGAAILELVTTVDGAISVVGSTNAKALNTVEYAYERFGLCIDSICNGRIRVILSVSPQQVEYGYVPLDLYRYSIQGWWKFMVDRPLFPIPSNQIAFYQHRGDGAVTYADLENTVFYPAEFDGDWVQLRSVYPSDYCSTTIEDRQERLVWLRYMTNGRNPVIWFYPRGC